MDIADEVMASDEAQKAFHDKFRAAFLSNPAKALREYVYPLTPQVSMTATQTGSGAVVRKLTITQLKELAAELDDEDRENSPPEISESSQVIDIDVDAGENGKPA